MKDAGFDSECICTAKVNYGTHMDCCGNTGTKYQHSKSGFRCKKHYEETPVRPVDPLLREYATQFVSDHPEYRTPTPEEQAKSRLANPYQKELDFFTDAMRYKLIKNAHKGRWENIDLKTALQLLKDEVAELEEAIQAGSQIDIILEGADIGNFAMIVTNIAVTEAAKRGGK